MRPRLRAALAAGSLVLAGGGCEDPNVSAPSSLPSETVFHLPGRSFRVEACRAEGAGMAADVSILEPEGTVPRTIRIASSGSSGWSGFRVECHDARLRYGLAVSWRAGDPNRMRFEAYDGRDALVVDRSFSGGFLTEIYRYGHRADTLRVRGPFDLTDPGAPRWDVPPGSQRHTPWARATPCAESVWLGLDRSLEGERLAGLVWNTRFGSWLAARLGAEGGPGPAPALPELVCLCWMGTGRNPLCDPGGVPGAFRAWTSVARALEGAEPQGGGAAMPSFRNRIALPSSVRTAIRSSPR